MKDIPSNFEDFDTSDGLGCGERCYLPFLPECRILGQIGTFCDQEGLYRRPHTLVGEGLILMGRQSSSSSSLLETSTILPGLSGRIKVRSLKSGQRGSTILIEDNWSVSPV